MSSILIGFIQNKVFKMIEDNLAGGQQSDKSSRSGDDNVGTFFQGLSLLIPRCAITAAINRDRANADKISKAFNLLIDLLCQFPCWCNDQRIQVAFFSRE